MSGISGTEHDAVSRRALLVATAAAAVTTPVLVSRPLPSRAAAPLAARTTAVRAGNHDQLISGWTAAPDDYFAGVATGSRKVESVPDAEAHRQYALNTTELLLKKPR